MSGAAGRTYTRRARLPFRTLEGETVILDPRQSGVHVLNSTGTLIWQLLDRWRSPEEVVTLLGDGGEFDADPIEILADVEGFLGEMVTKGLVVAGPSADGDR